MYITFKDKEIDVEYVCEGVVKRGKSYYIMDNNSNEYKICSQDRMDKLIAKHGSIEEVGINNRSNRSSSSNRADVKATVAYDPSNVQTIDDIVQPSMGGWVDASMRFDNYDGPLCYCNDEEFEF